MTRRAGGCLLPLVLATLELSAAEFFVSPTGTSSLEEGTGSRRRPWSLAAALAHPPAVRPGDTIWLEGGSYVGTYLARLTGTREAPIVVRALPGERVTVDGKSSGGEPILKVMGAHTWFWGLEVTSSDTSRRSAGDDPQPGDIGRGEGILIVQAPGAGVGTRFINMVVHDTRQGFSLWKEAEDAEVYGCLIDHNGWVGPTRGHGHGVYVQNEAGTKLLEDNIVFRNFSHGFHAYGSDAAYLNGIAYVRNTVFSNGEPSGDFARNLLTGGGRVAESPRWEENMTFTPEPWGLNEIGYDAGCRNASVARNYLVGTGKAIEMKNCAAGLAMTGNTFYGLHPPEGLDPAAWAGNTFTDARPTGTKVFVRKNRYEPGRANVTVYAWEARNTIPLDPSGILQPGETYEVRDAQNFFGPPVASGVWAGAPITLPLAGLPAAAPVGLTPLAATGPLFNAFVLVATGRVASPPSASFRTLPRSAVARRPVTFLDETRPWASTWSWDFGDGARATQQSPSHVFAAPGAYAVTLTVTNPAGSDAVTASVVVAPDPGGGDAPEADAPLSADAR